MSARKILVTGTVGFIGFRLINVHVEQGYNIVELDSINNY